MCASREPCTASYDRSDSSDQRERAERAEPIEANDPTDHSEHALPIEPTEHTDPTEPIESTDPVDAMQSSERSERIDQRDVGVRRHAGGIADAPAARHATRASGAAGRRRVSPTETMAAAAPSDVTSDWSIMA